MQEATGVLAAPLCDSVSTRTRRMDTLVTRRAERARKDAEEAKAREEQQISDALSKLPNPDLPASWSDDGELATHPASQPEDVEELEASEHNDNEGDLPVELTNETPVVTGTSPNFSGSREPTAKNPAGVSW